MKKPWTRSEKLLWVSPLLVAVFVGVVFYGPQIMRRSLGWPTRLSTVSGNQIRSMALSPNGEILAAGSFLQGKNGWLPGSGTIYLWDARTAKSLGTVPPIYKKDKLSGISGWEIYALTFSPDAKSIGFSRMEHNWCLYDVATKKLIWRFNNHVSAARFSPDGRFIALSGGQIAIVRASDGRLHTLCKISGSTNSNHIAWSPDGKLVASIGSYETGNPIEFHSTLNGKLVRRINTEQGLSGEIVANVNFSPDGKQLITASFINGYSSTDSFKLFAPVRCYDVATGSLVWDVNAAVFGGADAKHSDFCDAAFSPDGRTIAAYQRNPNRIFLLNRSGAIQKTLSLGNAEGTNNYMPPSLFFSPDGKRLFARGKEEILFWDLP